MLDQYIKVVGIGNITALLDADCLGLVVLTGGEIFLVQLFQDGEAGIAAVVQAEMILPRHFGDGQHL